MKTTATAFRLDEEIIPALKKIAKEQDRSVNWLVNNTLKNFIEGEKKRRKRTADNGLQICEVKNGYFTAQFKHQTKCHF